MGVLTYLCLRYSYACAYAYVILRTSLKCLPIVRQYVGVNTLHHTGHIYNCTQRFVG